VASHWHSIRLYTGISVRGITNTMSQMACAFTLCRNCSGNSGISSVVGKRVHPLFQAQSSCFDPPIHALHDVRTQLVEVPDHRRAAWASIEPQQHWGFLQRSF